MTAPKYEWCCVSIDAFLESMAEAVEVACQKLENGGAEIFAVNGPVFLDDGSVALIVVARTPLPETRRKATPPIGVGPGRSQW